MLLYDHANLPFKLDCVGEIYIVRNNCDEKIIDEEGVLYPDCSDNRKVFRTSRSLSILLMTNRGVNYGLSI